MIKKIKKIFFLALSIFLVSFLVGAQTTISNLIWLISIDMPITLEIFFSSIYHDFVLMSLTPVPPAPFPLLLSIITIGFFISFAVTWVLLKWVDVQKKYAYGIAGAMALVSIVYLMPLIFFGVDALAGARTSIGKVTLIICGYLGGHFFGSRLNRVEI
tara:strand:- start:1213 stop:1686 length:474 start_codon:yes stop_codon:yes gene_type:complete